MKKIKHTLKSCKESASRYKTRIEWRKGDLKSFSSAKKNGWYDECCINMPYLKRGKKTFLTLEDCKNIASKYKSRSEWRKSDSKSLFFAYSKGWVDECCATMIDYKTKAKHIAIEDILEDDFFEINYINKESIIMKIKYYSNEYYTLDLEIY